MTVFQQKRLEKTAKVINVRKIAGQLTGTTSTAPVSDALANVGSAKARLFWRNKWTWSSDEHAFNRDLNSGLSGGPMISLGIPIAGPNLSIEARASALEYALPEQQRRPSTPDELMRDHDNQMSFEGGLYLNFSFDGK